MDRVISQSNRNKRRIRQLAVAALVLLALATLWWLARSGLKPSVNRSQIRVATVERGNVVASIDTVGILEPGIEQSLTSPVDSIVTAVLAFPGESVVAGQILLRLENIEQTRLLNELKEKLQLKQNEQQGSQLTLRSAQDELDASLELKKIDLKYRKARHQRLTTLAANGGVSQDELLKASFDVTRSEVEISKLEKSISNQQQSNAVTLRRIELETSILAGQLVQARRVLDQTTVRAPADGYLAFLLEQLGESVTRGTELARVSDPKSFRVKAKLSDFYANRIYAGMSVTIRDGARNWPGRLSRVVPEPSEGSLALIVDFEDHQIQGLRMQQRVDIELLFDDNPDTMRVSSGRGLRRSGAQALFVLSDATAVRTEVTVGVRNRQYVSLESGVSLGDRIIVSDMNDYLHLEEIQINRE